MAFGNVPKDATGIPIAEVYTPGVGFAAMQGGPQTSDGSSNAFAPVIFSQTVGSALADWTSQPTQTAAAAADTVLKFGTSGTTAFAHFSIANNSTINFIYRIDADSTASGAKVYIVPPGGRVWEDRSGSTLHCHTASQISFGGDTGVTVETFA